jgi:Xaa-Pro dipeptidase
MAPPDLVAGFTAEEYRRRWEAVSKELVAHELDAICITEHAHRTYMTGCGLRAYDACWPLIVTPDRPPTLVVRRYDEDTVRATGVIDDLVVYGDTENPVEVWADALRSRGLAVGRIGLESSLWGVTPSDVERLERLLPSADFTDVGALVTAITEVKSAEELTVMREAMSITRIGFDAFMSCIAEGVSEWEASTRVIEASYEAGSEVSWIPHLLFGQRTALPHGAVSAGPTSYRLRQGDVAFMEHSGWRLGYAAGLARTAILGSNLRAEELYRIADEAQAAAIATIRAGVTAGEVDDACRGVVMRAGRGESFRHRTGYAIGINWTDRGATSLAPDRDTVLKPDMTFHMPTILFEKGEFCIGCSETVRVTEDGCEVLSATSRQLVHC